MLNNQEAEIRAHSLLSMVATSMLMEAQEFEKWQWNNISAARAVSSSIQELLIVFIEFRSFGMPLALRSMVCRCCWCFLVFFFFGYFFEKSDMFWWLNHFWVVQILAMLYTKNNNNNLGSESAWGRTSPSVSCGILNWDLNFSDEEHNMKK